MELLEIEERKNEEKKNEDTYRVTVSKAAEKALVELLGKVNQDFTAGQVNRSQLASWVLTRFVEDATAEDIRAIRMEHINEVALLEYYYRQAKETGKLQPEVRDFIRRLAGIDESQRKPTKKNLKNVINDDIKTDMETGCKEKRLDEFERS